MLYDVDKINKITLCCSNNYGSHGFRQYEAKPDLM